ncbi:unnamed protein product [Cyprideis torosa]|uniref:Uncharacterized protein n=1 Tax=Cyprideis torosa TaxID=163714 RepID=A0A7R8WFS0_9CRUS|nr:unnamed protein product [Cyprideis torosa]CAG0891743.1 unnamed protein product [Cyprideis torosa]
MREPHGNILQKLHVTIKMKGIQHGKVHLIRVVMLFKNSILISCTNLLAIPLRTTIGASLYGQEEELAVSITPHIYADHGDVVELDFICEGSRTYLVCRWYIHDKAFTFELADDDFDGNPLTCDFRVTSERLESLLSAQDTHPSGEWRCELYDDDGIFGIGTARLTAAVTPTPPQIDPPKEISVREDEFAELTCTSARGRPGSNITWYIADTEGEIISPLEELAQCNITVEERDLGQEIVDVISTVNCTFPPETNKRKLMCWADHPYASQNFTSVDINVEFVSLPYEIEGDVPPGFLSVEGDSYKFYAVPVGTRVELKVLFQASDLPSVVRWKSETFGELESDSRNSKYESKPARLYSAEEEKGPEVDRTDVYVASLVIDPTSAKDFTVSYEFQVEDDVSKDFTVSYEFQVEDYVCIPGGNTPECMTIDFVITEGAKTVEAGLTGGAIAGIVIACIVVVLIILIIVLARIKRILCFGDQDLLKKLHYSKKPRKDATAEAEEEGTVNPATSIEKVNGNGHQQAVALETNTSPVSDSGDHKTEGSETESSAGGVHEGDKKPGFSTRLVSLFKPSKDLKKDPEANKEETEMLEKKPDGAEEKKEEGVVYAELNLKQTESEPPKKETTEYSEIRHS